MCALSPRAELRIHADAGAVAVRRASSDDNEFQTSVHRQRAECFLPAMFQNQRDSLTQIRETLFMRFALTIGAGNFRAIRNVPRAILLDDRCEFVTHASF